MKALPVLLMFVSFHAKGQLIQEADFDHMHIRFEISNIISDDSRKVYSFDYTFQIHDYDSIGKYIVVEDPLHDTAIVSSFSPRYYLSKIMNFYFGTCDESDMPLSCRITDDSLFLRKLHYGDVLSVKKTVRTRKDILAAIRKPEADIVFKYFDGELNERSHMIDQRLIRVSYWNAVKEMKRLVLKMNMQNYRY